MDPSGGVLLCGDRGVGYGDIAVAVAEDACTAFRVGGDRAAGECQGSVCGKGSGAGAVEAGVVAAGAVGGGAVDREVI